MSEQNEIAYFAKFLLTKVKNYVECMAKDVRASLSLFTKMTLKLICNFDELKMYF